MLASRWGWSPPKPFCREWLQTIASCVGQEPVVVNVRGKGAEGGQSPIRISRRPRVDVVERALETEAPVRAIKVVVIDVLGEPSMEVSIVDDNLVQTLRAY